MRWMWENFLSQWVIWNSSHNIEKTVQNEIDEWFSDLYEIGGSIALDIKEFW